MDKQEHILYVVVGKTITSLAIPQLDRPLGARKVVRTLTKNLQTNFAIEFPLLVKQLIGEKIDEVYICSVTPSLNKTIKYYFENQEVPITFLTNQNQDVLDLTKLYNSWDLGADLIAQLIYITHFFKEAIVVSLGTITAIYHTQDNALNGVVLLPGIKGSLNYLEQVMDIKLLDLKSEEEKLLGLSNQEAISLGLINTVEIVVDNLVQKLGTKCPIIYSGGNSYYFHNKNWWHIEDLDLLGLYIFGRQKIFNKKLLHDQCPEDCHEHEKT